MTYQSNQSPSLKLERLYSSSDTLLGSVNGLNLEDEKFHQLRWSRDKNGAMSISIDGRNLISVQDQGFRDDFAGLSLTNGGGDFIVKSVEVSGR